MSCASPVAPHTHLRSTLPLIFLHPHTPLPPSPLHHRHYYEKLSGTLFGLALPGLGYDCFRTWELLTMGTIVILERGVGLDRTVSGPALLPPAHLSRHRYSDPLPAPRPPPICAQLWRLPALLLDDFDDVTPALLRYPPRAPLHLLQTSRLLHLIPIPTPPGPRSAYVEALYRADEFEFERLTQSFWYTVITNVSASMSIEPLLAKFPMRAEDVGFTRPRVPYECGKTGTCGPGTKRTPKRSC